MLKRFLPAGLLVAGLVSLLPNVAPAGQILDYSAGLGSAAGLKYNGNAAPSGTNAKLTDGGFNEAGSVFATTMVNFSNWSASFNFQLTSGTQPIADGITFTMQSNGPTALGSSGGGLGYAGILNSVAVKFDTFNNAGEGTDSTGIYTGGANPTVPAIDLTGTGIDLHSSDVFNAAINYDGANLNVTITDTSTLASASQSYSVDIPSIIGGTNGYVGFTGGTGSLTSVQEIQNFTFTSANPAPTPAPSTLIMSSILFAMFGVVRSYKRLKQTATAA